MTKNIDIGEDTKLELSILAAKHGCNLKAFIEAQLNAMAETGISFTELFQWREGLKKNVKTETILPPYNKLVDPEHQPTNDLKHK